MGSDNDKTIIGMIERLYEKFDKMNEVLLNIRTSNAGLELTMEKQKERLNLIEKQLESHNAIIRGLEINNLKVEEIEALNKRVSHLENLPNIKIIRAKDNLNKIIYSSITVLISGIIIYVIKSLYGLITNIDLILKSIGH